jgi:hypothetical protein
LLLKAGNLLIDLGDLSGSYAATVMNENGRINRDFRSEFLPALIVRFAWDAPTPI